MDIPCRVSADLRRREEENDRAEEWFADNRKQMIQEEEDKLHSGFCMDDLIEAISEASAEDQVALFQAFKEGDAADCLAMLRDMRNSYCKRYAEDYVENM